MTNPVIEQAEGLVLGFVKHLYTQPTIHYAINHGLMEAWVALEGLEYCARSECKSWETIGFITNRPVNSKKKKKGAGCKFPDIVCVKGRLSLWWEFKGICQLALHPKSAGGTFVKDVAALRAFDRERTKKYLQKGTLLHIRDRNDINNITASGLQKTLGAGFNIGVALLFYPGADRRGADGKVWSPEETVRALAEKLPPEVRDISGAIRETIATTTQVKSTPSRVRGTPAEAARPRCAGWLVPMEGEEYVDPSTAGGVV